MQNDKIKLTKEEFEDMYEITGDTEATLTPEPVIPDKQDTTPEFLTQEEQEQDDFLHENLNTDEEKDK